MLKYQLKLLFCAQCGDALAEADDTAVSGWRRCHHKSKVAVEPPNLVAHCHCGFSWKFAQAVAVREVDGQSVS